jgi:quercetin dioxygenase-like cupin family protein
MEIKRIGSQPSNKGPADWFTGTVRIDSPFKGSDAARVGGAIVTFEPGARTAWHTHPLGQTLIVTAGCGRVQREGAPIEAIHPGDIVWFPPGEKHWHGAARRNLGSAAVVFFPGTLQAGLRREIEAQRPPLAFPVNPRPLMVGGFSLSVHIPVDAGLHL